MEEKDEKEKIYTFNDLVRNLKRLYLVDEVHGGEIIEETKTSVTFKEDGVFCSYTFHEPLTKEAKKRLKGDVFVYLQSTKDHEGGTRYCFFFIEKQAELNVRLLLNKFETSEYSISKQSYEVLTGVLFEEKEKRKAVDMVKELPEFRLLITTGSI